VPTSRYSLAYGNNAMLKFFFVASKLPVMSEETARKLQLITYYCSTVLICLVYFSGRQPYRTGLYGPLLVLLPDHRIGLPHDEVTIAEALRDFAGYSTGIVGKWHLGEAVVYICHLLCVHLKVLEKF